MRATKLLGREDRTIAYVAEACAVLAEMLDRGRVVPTAVIENVLNFLCTYVGRYHREREEWLLAMLRMKGVPGGSCPIASLGRDHAKIAVLTDQLARAVTLYSKSGGAVERTLADTLHSLAQVYSDHLWRLDYLLLPMAEKLLSEYEDRALVETMQMIESTRGAEARRSVAQLSEAIKACTECGMLATEAVVA